MCLTLEYQLNLWVTFNHPFRWLTVHYFLSLLSSHNIWSLHVSHIIKGVQKPESKSCFETISFWSIINKKAYYSFLISIMKCSKIKLRNLIPFAVDYKSCEFNRSSIYINVLLKAVSICRYFNDTSIYTSILRSIFKWCNIFLTRFNSKCGWIKL